MTQLQNDYQDAMAWLTNIVYHGTGAIEIGLTSSGDIGLWYPSDQSDESQKPVGTGQDVLEAIFSAMPVVAASAPVPGADDGDGAAGRDGGEVGK